MWPFQTIQYILITKFVSKLIEQLITGLVLSELITINDKIIARYLLEVPSYSHI